MKKKIILLFIAVAFFLLCLEFAVRLYAWKTGKGFFEKPKSFVSHFFTIYDWPAPDYENGKYIFKKNEVAEPVKKKNELRIICFGGSTTLNVRNSKKLVYSQLVQEKLRKKFPDLEINVYNAGGDAFSSAHTLVNYTLRCLKLKPDIITVYHNINDLTANYYGEYVDSDYSNKYKTDHFLAYRFRNGLYGNLLRFSYLCRYINSRTMFFTNAEFNKKLDYRRGIEYFENNLRNIYAVSNINGIKMVIGTQAARSDQRKNQGFIAYNNVINNIAGKYDIPVFDAYNELQDDRYFLDEVHLTSEGVEKISEVIYNSLSETVEKNFSSQ